MVIPMTEPVTEPTATVPVAPPYEKDALDRKIVENFPGKIVRKDLTALMKRGAGIPTFVLEYLLGMLARLLCRETFAVEDPGYARTARKHGGVV